MKEVCGVRLERAEGGGVEWTEVASHSHVTHGGFTVEQ